MHEIKNILTKIAVTVLITVLLGACGQQPDDAMMITNDDYTRIAASIVRQEDRVSAGQLARWIAAEKAGFIVVDIRPKSEFELGHIQHATSIPLQMLVSDKGQAQLPVGKALVLYSNGNENAAKAAVMLRLAGFDARLLHGGYNHWGPYMINPAADLVAVDEEILTFNERRALACSSCAPGTANTAFTPVVTPVVDPENPEDGNVQKKKKKRAGDEGC
jgi:rhodanese-related sulfurtransferase